MANFDLSIQISPEDTETINSQGFMVTIVKGSHTSPGDPSPLWLAFAPFEQNSVTWTDEYGVFASPDPIQPETVISASSTQFPARPGVIYPFANNVFGSPTGTLAPDQYGADNKSGNDLTFGLLQGATVNGTIVSANPVNAIALPDLDRAVFQPIEVISVFLHRQVDTGTVIVSAEGPALTVDMASSPSQSIHYDGEEFVLGPLG